MDLISKCFKNNSTKGCTSCFLIRTKIIFLLSQNTKIFLNSFLCYKYSFYLRLHYFYDNIVPYNLFYTLEICFISRRTAVYLFYFVYCSLIYALIKYKKSLQTNHKLIIESIKYDQAVHFQKNCSFRY